jgi:hypothetical protein
VRAGSHDSKLIGRGKYILSMLLAADGFPETGIFGTAAENGYSTFQLSEWLSYFMFMRFWVTCQLTDKILCLRFSRFYLVPVGIRARTTHLI